MSVLNREQLCVLHKQGFTIVTIAQLKYIIVNPQKKNPFSQQKPNFNGKYHIKNANPSKTTVTAILP